MRFEGQGEITRSRQARPTYMLLSFLPALRSLLSPGKGHHALFELAYAIVLVAVVCDLVWMWRRRIRARAGVLSGDEVGVSIDGENVIAGRDIEAAYVTSNSDSTVRIERRRAPAVGLRLQTTKDARALVESLGFGLAHEPLRVGVSPGHGGGDRGNSSTIKTRDRARFSMALRARRGRRDANAPRLATGE